MPDRNPRATKTQNWQLEKQFALQQDKIWDKRIGNCKVEAANYQPMPSPEADGLLDDSVQAHEHRLGAVVAGDHHLGVPRQHGHLILAPACRHSVDSRNHLANGSAPYLPRILPELPPNSGVVVCSEGRAECGGLWPG